MDTPTTTNIPEYAVSDLNQAIKRTLEGSFGRVRVKGEITELKRHTSGHVYLALKDETAKIEAVIWKGTVRSLGTQPENGAEVIATGKLTTYADRSKYQLIIDKLEYAGAGALLARIEALRQKLVGEGLFAAERKRALPRLPLVVGVVTSASGAVIQDIRTTILRRFPRHILIWPVAVQGAGSAEQIARAIAGFSAIPLGGRIPRPDVVIVARGGGSLEDLMAFNEEVVVRAAAASLIPLISAVGHETDTTLIDFASDRRAPTPTAAAELAVPARADLMADLAQTGARLQATARRVLNDARMVLLRVERRLPDVPGRIEQARLRLDDYGERLPRGVVALVARRRERLAALRVPHPREAIVARRRHLVSLIAQGNSGMAQTLAAKRDARALARFSVAPVDGMLRQRRTALEGLWARLESASYQAVLARGFVLVRDAEGAPLTRAEAMRPAQKITLVFGDGEVGATTEGAKPRRAKPGTEQGALL
ncbi:exodeoxyribonuclease VII large subunit [Plastoroseomonas arctica]|uniref:Exodeoxyribonuclease 7 large subunit n=1 Tax=Plastoroseomonas arctica TaxID=1509237 RepID=A0AAF1K0I8_9PROT|nr:exodeoxyribonuclease VII large subunit [Plastoroseomonas arctica]MBR0654035.1 exodeoxyribonuclease VII large subunit [Plastoroseomonas arctica]